MYKEVVYKDPKTLKLAPTNVRVDTIPPEKLEALRLSIMSEGILEPIVINTNDEVVIGGTRWKIACELGLKEVPCVVKEFKDKYEERISCFIQDELHNSLTDHDKYEFVRKAISEDGKTIEQIAKSVGMAPITIRQWAKLEEIPVQIKDNPKAQQSFLDIPWRKRLALQSALKTKQFQDPIKATELIEKTYQHNLSLSTVEEISKDAHAGVPINLETRVKLDKSDVRHVEFKIPNRVYLLFMAKVRELKLDPKEVVIFLLEKFANGEIVIGQNS